MGIRVDLAQAVAYRLRVNNLTERLPAGSYEQAAAYAVQDTYPRSALLSLHARVADCEPTAWERPGLLQTYSPRAAVHVLPATDIGIFTVGRLPLDPEARRVVLDKADRACRAMTSARSSRQEMPEGFGAWTRQGAASGRIGMRWDASSLSFRELPPPSVDPEFAQLELCRRHVHAFGPTNPVAFAWWAGLSTPDGRQIWRRLAAELILVDLAGQDAWILASDEAALSSAVADGVRLLPAEELRLFGLDRTGVFVAPTRKMDWPGFDTFHPHGVLVDGRIVGAWGRRGGRVSVRLSEVVGPGVREAIEAEALSFPIPRARMSVRFG